MANAILQISEFFFGPNCFFSGSKEKFQCNKHKRSPTYGLQVVNLSVIHNLLIKEKFCEFIKKTAEQCHWPAHVQRDKLKEIFSFKAEEETMDRFPSQVEFKFIGNKYIDNLFGKFRNLQV